ncbi:MAG TPA: lipoyl domain-containing protein [Candidatus Binatia bacterium]|jgi:pyruvate/2-oxoglutarate dehydrogenase complex dihydrolipoamide acyltransferase (E2) component
MMTREVIIPRLGSSEESDEVRILQWLKAIGEKVQKGEALLEVESDKVNVEIEAPDDGVLHGITRGRWRRQVGFCGRHH